MAMEQKLTDRQKKFIAFIVVSFTPCACILSVLGDFSSLAGTNVIHISQTVIHITFFYRWVFLFSLLIAYLIRLIQIYQWHPYHG